VESIVIRIHHGNCSVSVILTLKVSLKFPSKTGGGFCCREKVKTVNIRLHYTVLYRTVLYRTALHYTVPYCTTLYSTALHYTALHCTALYCTVLRCTTLHYTVQYCTALHCTAVCRTVCRIVRTLGIRNMTCIGWISRA
jgi:hypothetical protein